MVEFQALAEEVFGERHFLSLLLESHPSDCEPWLQSPKSGSPSLPQPRHSDAMGTPQRCCRGSSARSCGSSCLWAISPRSQQWGLTQRSLWGEQDFPPPRHATVTSVTRCQHSGALRQHLCELMRSLRPREWEGLYPWVGGGSSLIHSITIWGAFSLKQIPGFWRQNDECVSIAGKNKTEQNQLAEAQQHKDNP